MMPKTDGIGASLSIVEECSIERQKTLFDKVGSKDLHFLNGEVTKLLKIRKIKHIQSSP